VVGRSYAFRATLSPGSAVLKVKLVEKVGRKGKLKIRFEDGPHPGLEEYINTRQIVASCGGRRALLRDEERAGRLAEYESDRHDRALADAVDAVLAATGEPGMGADESELQRILDRAGVHTPPSRRQARQHPLSRALVPP
jgi:hypothetical protein